MPPLSKEHKLKLSKAKLGLKGPLNNSWTGNKPEYHTLHIWLKSEYGKANHCDLCGLKEIPKRISNRGKLIKTWFEWSNKTKVYERDLKNWWQLCIPCHRSYDRPPKSNRRCRDRGKYL